MSANQASANACKHCDKTLPENHSGRICPACLMAEALEVSEVLEGGSLEETSPELSRESTTPDSLEGTTIGLDGRYKLLQRIGEGGFGTVYMAEQSTPVRRRVAVKILKPGMDTRQFVARFEAERQALAMMDHPNIARIIDGGESRQGRPFLVMELVRGIPITTYCDQENFGTGQRLDLFIKVCRAVQHAHQKGIIHRDLKPGNILVTVEDGAEPVPKVIDFGVAKAADTQLTDKTLFTRFEQMIGTPAYMSPEQAGAQASHDVDTRADIYALGVLLYELLTGTTPIEEATLKGAAFDEVRRILREDEAPRPSARLSSLELDRRTTIARSRDTQAATLGRQLRGDLDWIVMKAIEKDRRRRYDTANALAADVERHLEDEPVSAGPPTAGYRTGKFLRRHKSTVAVAAAMVVLLVAGIAASSWQAIRATAEKRRANEEKQSATEEKQRALEAEALAEARLEEAEAISDFLVGMFESAEPGAEDGGRTITVVESLKIAEKKLEADEEIPAKRRAVLQEAIARVFKSLGRGSEATDLYKRVRDYYIADLARRRETAGPEHPDTLGAMLNLAGRVHDAGAPEEALTMRESNVALMRKVLGPEHPATLMAMHNLAHSYRHGGHKDEALEMREEVLELCVKVLGAEHLDTLRAMISLTASYGDTGHKDEALEMGEEVLALCRKVLGPEHSSTLGTMHNLTIFYREAGRRDEALAMAEELLALRRKVLGPEHPDTLEAMYALAESYDVGRKDEALAMREELLALRRKVLGPEHPGTLTTMHILASSYHSSGRLDEALAMREEVLPLRRKVLGPERPNTLDALNNLAISYHSSGRLDEALAMFEELLALRRKVLGPEHPDTLTAMYSLAYCYRDGGRKDEALEMFEELLELRRKVLGPERPDTLKAMNNLAISYHDSGRLDEALAMREEVLPLRKVLGPEHPDTLNAMNNLAVSYRAAGRKEEALAMREVVLALRRKVLGPEHPHTLRAVNNLGNSYHDADRNNEALAVREQQLELCSKIKGNRHPDTRNARLLLADAYGKVGRIDEAISLNGGGQLLLKPDSPAVSGVLVPPTSEWRWYHPVDGVDPAETEPNFHRRFFHGDYDDSAWQRGTDSENPTGGFGYGDEGFAGIDIGTPGEKDLGKSAYFRRRFTTDREFTNIELRCHRDDGIIVYLDGKEVLRDNMTEGEEAYILPAQWTTADAAETAVFRFPLGDLTLPAGEHVLAISLHNTEAPSSDLRIGGITLVEVE